MSQTIIHSAVVFDGKPVHPPSTVVFNNQSGVIETITQDKGRFGFDDRGVIEAGRKADLVLVRGKPHGSVDALWADDAMVGIWKNGFRAE